MDCSERDRLKLQHGEAILEWTSAGGLDPMKARDETVIAANEKIWVAANAVIDHRNAHGC